MAIYYIIFIIAHMLNTFSTFLNKKYQLTAGTGIFAISVYMIINGFGAILVSLFALVINGEAFEATLYSLLMALLTVVCAAIGTIVTLKAYEVGHMAEVTVCSSIGGIVISCAWGFLLLHEQLAWKQVVAVVLMIISVILLILQKGMKMNQSMLWLAIVAAVSSGFVSIIAKQHQIEKVFLTVNTLSYSVWVGVFRVIIFSGIFWRLLKKNNRDKLQLSKNSLFSATGAAIAGCLAYIATLIVTAVLPLAITSTFGTALGIVLTLFMARIAYREKMSRRQTAGVGLCILGIFLFA